MEANPQELTIRTECLTGLELLQAFQQMDKLSWMRLLVMDPGLLQPTLWRALQKRAPDAIMPLLTYLWIMIVGPSYGYHPIVLAEDSIERLRRFAARVEEARPGCRVEISKE